MSQRPAPVVLVAMGLVAPVLLGACGAKRVETSRAEHLGSIVHDRPLGDVPVRGHDVEVSRARGGSVDGELLAVDSGGVLVATGKRIVHIPWGNIERVKCEPYEVVPARSELYQYARFPQGAPPEVRARAGAEP